MIKYINGIGITGAEAIYIDLVCVLNNNTIFSEKFVVNEDTFRMMYMHIGNTIEMLDAKKAEMKKAN